MDGGRRALKCSLGNANRTTTATVQCGPIQGGMGVDPIALDDAVMTVSGELVDLQGGVITTLTLPALTDADTISAIPYQADDPKTIADTEWAAYDATDVAGDYVEPSETLTDTIIIDNGQIFNSKGYAIGGIWTSDIGGDIKYGTY